MSIVVPQTFVRRWFARAFNNGEVFDYASLDSQHADLVETMNLITNRLNLISTPAGTLVTLDSTTSFTATASQTAFTVPTYNVTYDTVHVYLNGLRLLAASITKTSETVVTIPAQVVGTLVQIDIFTPGQGTTSLASTSVGLGASLVGINDAGALFTATTVEGALQEVATNLASAAYLEGVLTMSNYIKKDGSVTFTGAQSMGGFKLTNLGAGTAGSNDAARMADITSAALVAATTAAYDARYLQLSGGTMSGNIAMGGNKVTGLGAASANGQAVRYEQLINIDGSWITTGTVAAARMAVMVGDTGAGGTQGVVPAPAAGDGAALKFLRADATWQVPASNPGSYAHLQFRVASGVAGVANVAAAWTTRILNLEVSDNAAYCSLNTGTGVFTLSAGTYRIEARASFFQVDGCTLRLRNITDAVTQPSTGTASTIMGVKHRIDTGELEQRPCELRGRFTITAPKDFAIQYYAEIVGTFGQAFAATGEEEIYAEVILIKE